MKTQNKHTNKRDWHIASWAIEWLGNCIAIVGYIYSHPDFKDGQKVYIKVKSKRIYKYIPEWNC